MTEKTYAQFTADNGETVMVSPVYQVAVEQMVAYRKQEWEKELREQIAREISTEEESFECPNFHPVGMSGCDYCIPFRYGLETAAAIARGEPNQVTKDAIEEARKMNDLR